MTTFSYISASDFRPGSGKWYTHGLELSVDDADDNALSDAIQGACQSFDLYTFDHYAPEPGGDPEGTVDVLLAGSGGPNLYVPKRIRSISSVTLIDFQGTETVQDTTVYRVTQSLGAGDDRAEADLDMVTIIPGQRLNGNIFWDDWSYPAAWTTWPSAVGSVRITGQFSWAHTPEPVKRAVALMVYDSIKPVADKMRRAQDWANSEVRFTMASSNPTGMPEVDGIIAQFTRDRIPAV